MLFQISVIRYFYIKLMIKIFLLNEMILVNQFQENLQGLLQPLSSYSDGFQIHHCSSYKSKIGLLSQH